MKLDIFQLRVSNSKYNVLFFNFELLTWKWNKKMFNYLVNNSKQIFLSFDFELVTRSATFYFSTSTS